MTDVSGDINVTLTAEDIEYLMESGTSKVRLSDGPISVYALCRDSLQFEVVTDE